MNKKVIYLLLKVLIIIFLLPIVSCGSNLFSKESIYRYIDGDPIEGDNFKLNLGRVYCGNSVDNEYISMSFNLINQTYSTQTYNVKNVEIIKESTGAVYTVDCSKDVLQIEAEMSGGFTISKSLPSSIYNDKYKLCFDINKYRITYFLYETPDELRTDFTVEYYVNNEKVFSDTVKEKRSIDDLFVYESKDKLKYCDIWYTDKYCSNKFDIDTKVEDNLKLYGEEKMIVKCSGYTADKYASIYGINHIPSDGVLVIPEKYNNKEITIGTSVIKNVNLTKIYIPKTVRIIYSNNFININNATIYYEGNEEEWKTLFYNSSKIVTDNVIYNTKYNY